MSTQYQAGYKMKALRYHMEKCVGKQIAQRLDAEMTDISLRLNPKNMGHGMDLMYQKYKAEFYLDRFPFKKYDPAVLFANVGAWLLDNDDERNYSNELSDPDIDVVIEDENSAEVLIIIEFEEAVKVIEDENGPIYWRGKNWRIAEYEIWVAETLRDVVAQ
ncbi:phage tail protein [bacterium 19MO03SA05]|uniref:Phage tail protein n=1 Tax=bacterium 19MO03SA05 TaxID=2920620 RepID=A0AAU6VIH8_UNCXX